MSQQEQSKNEPAILEQGDIYFFYRPKKDAQKVRVLNMLDVFSWLLHLKASSSTGYL